MFSGVRPWARSKCAAIRALLNGAAAAADADADADVGDGEGTEAGEAEAATGPSPAATAATRAPAATADTESFLSMTSSCLVELLGRTDSGHAAAARRRMGR
ncbi:hypothetical protein Saso_48610 [Streptomyces asoensis]|uniref:Uncharacterized protein n=1 Tax=Streptomyces asoensis TaxID=249586 RepID=A0ABQ3S508_9ACTN|nr:hypothetical protein GCM10010496_31080 [Streptomyces asoensis]GHI63211.1 hypothetical protein Saso_48610 [Streptomyces asoensis]